jgi:ABC-2 type transport system ATP-binding protein
MSAAEYLIYSGRLHGLDKKSAIIRARDLFSEFDLINYSSWRIKKYSTGMKKKLALMQALIHSPDVMLLDEPTSNLDPLARGDLMKRLKSMAENQGKTFLISSHVLAELDQYIDTVTLIDKGHIQLQGSMADIKAGSADAYFLKTDSYDNTKVILTRLNIAISDSSPDKGFMIQISEDLTNSLFANLIEAGIRLEEFKKQDVSLAEVYRRTMTESREVF